MRQASAVADGPARRTISWAATYLLYTEIEAQCDKLAEVRKARNNGICKVF